MLKNLLQDKEGLRIMLHFILSMVIIIAYITLKVIGIADDTLSIAVGTVLGWWFGANRLKTKEEKLKQ